MLLLHSKFVSIYVTSNVKIKKCRKVEVKLFKTNISYSPKTGHFLISLFARSTCSSTRLALIALTLYSILFIIIHFLFAKQNYRTIIKYQIIICQINLLLISDLVLKKRKKNNLSQQRQQSRICLLFFFLFCFEDFSIVDKKLNLLDHFFF